MCFLSFQVISKTGDFLLEMPKKRNSVVVSVMPECDQTILVECNCSNVFSILFNHGKSSFEEFCFSIYAFVLCWHKLFSIIAIIDPVH